MYKAALFYIEQTVTLHIVLFNVLAQMLLLVSCLFAYQYLLCFVQGQDKRTIEKENETYYKETVEFHNQFVLLTMIAVNYLKVRVFPTA